MMWTCYLLLAVKAACRNWKVAAHNLEGVCDNADGHQLLSVVAAVHHERVGESLNDRALRLAETLDGVSSCGVGDVDRLSDLNVVAVHPHSSAFYFFLPRCHIPSPNWHAIHVRERNIPDLDILVTPFVEQLRAADLADHVLGQDGVALRSLNFDFAVRHDRYSSLHEEQRENAVVVVGGGVVEWWS
jgi:hypothetical protein